MFSTPGGQGEAVVISAVGTVDLLLRGGRRVALFPRLEVTLPIAFDLERFPAYLVLEKEAKLLRLRDGTGEVFAEGPFDEKIFALFCERQARFGFFFIEFLLGRRGFRAVSVQVSQPSGRVNPLAFSEAGPLFRPDDKMRSLSKKPYLRVLLRSRSRVRAFKGQPGSITGGDAISPEEKARVKEHCEQYISQMEALAGPLPWDFDEARYEREQARASHHTVVNYYLEAVENTVLAQARSGKVLIDESHHRREILSLCAAFIRQARIFELTSEAYATCYRAADVYTTEALFGERWQPYDPLRPPAEGSGAEYVQQLQEGGARVPFPAPLPFEVCYLAWGEGVYLTPEQKQLRGIEPSIGAILVAHVITATGYAFELHRVAHTDRPGYGSQWYCIRTPDLGWMRAHLLDPWILHVVVSALNEHRSTILEVGRRSVEDALAFNRLKRVGIKRPEPKPYYLVYLRQDLVRETVRRAFPSTKSVTWSHRWDVRGHEVARVARGPLPLAPKLAARLERRGYKIFTEYVTPEVQASLIARRIPSLRQGEWLAVLTYWRGDYVKGPEGRPYIPSRYKPTRGILVSRPLRSRRDREGQQRPSTTSP